MIWENLMECARINTLEQTVTGSLPSYNKDLLLVALEDLYTHRKFCTTIHPNA